MTLIFTPDLKVYVVYESVRGNTRWELHVKVYFHWNLARVCLYKKEFIQTPNSSNADQTTQNVLFYP